VSLFCYAWGENRKNLDRALVNAYLVCNTNIDVWNSRMIRVGGPRTSFPGRLWRIAVLATAGALGSAFQAEAALYYWSDFDPGYYRPGPLVQRPKARHRQAKKIVAPEKESAKPRGPLIISISIDRQTLRIYDANGIFAVTPISTGMKGHPTPMGVFSVIQKHKLHHSNIYSNAPMPFMQRITWSGVAIHAGVLPGYPASHGCIRMPMAFAVKMWNWTKMGARVVVTPGEITPANFSHPLLAKLKVLPQPVAADEPKLDAPVAAKADKAVDTEANAKSAIAQTSLKLRSTLGHTVSATPAAEETKALVPSQTRTADASNTLPAAKPSVTMSDAAPAGGSAPPAAERAASSQARDSSKPDEKIEEEPVASKPEVSKSEAEPESAKHDEVASSGDKAADEKVAEAKSSEAAAAQTRPAEAAQVQAKAEDLKAEPTKADIPKSSEKHDDNAKVAATPAALPEPNKDQTRPISAVKAAAPKADPAAASKRSGQIAAFVSRKDSKLYVRQNFAPLFDAPVAIAPSDRPLGTHVFTAQVDKDDANVLHWSVVSLPAPTRHADRRDEDKWSSRRRKIAGAGPIEVKPLPAPDSPAEALDRLNLPADAMARITEALSTGGSIIVSDQGITAGETGEGTDFIVSLR
jgi:lipoprotein-anchoring transpeptidase ErfK/SrfK